MALPIPCYWCGEMFAPTRSDALFHSGACKQAYFRWKHKLDYLRAQVYNAVEDIESYLEKTETQKEAENALGGFSDWLSLRGFVGTTGDEPFAPEEEETANQLGVENA